MSVFKMSFKAIYAQPVETREGEWKTYMDEYDKHEFKIATICKGAALVGAGLSAVLCMIPALPVVAIGTAMLTGMFYGSGTVMQAIVRSDAETEMKGKFWDEGTALNLLKNVARYAIQPF